MEIDARVVVLVATRDRPQLLNMSIEAPRKQTARLQAILLVDNTSGKETVSSLAQEWGIPILRVEQN